MIHCTSVQRPSRIACTLTSLSDSTRFQHYPIPCWQIGKSFGAGPVENPTEYEQGKYMLRTLGLQVRCCCARCCCRRLLCRCCGCCCFHPALAIIAKIAADLKRWDTTQHQWAL